jgi:hypothetical protein
VVVLIEDIYQLSENVGESMKNLFRWLIGIVIGLFFITLVLLSVLVIFKIPIDLTRFKAPVEELLSKGLNRPVRIEKSVVISTSLNPYFTLKGFRIENPEGFGTDDFLSMDLARIQIELTPLLKKKVHITEIQVKGLHVTLEETGEGMVNWVFSSAEESKKESSASPEPAEKSSQQGPDLAGDTLVVRKLNLEDIKVDFYRPDGEEPVSFYLKSCLGAMLPGEPLHLDIDGKFLDFDYIIDVSIGSLEELIRDNKSWVEVNSKIAGTEMIFSGDVDLATAARSLILQTSVQGENLASLNDLIKIDLPPFSSYKIDTRLHLQAGIIELEKLVVQTGTSSLEGTAKILKENDKIITDLKLRSPLVQIDDFVFENWSWTEDEEAKADTGESEVTEKEQAREEEDKGGPENGLVENRKLIDPELLAKYESSISIDAEKVLSGQDILGSGQLQASLKSGRIKIDPLKVQLPGGKIEMMASIKPGVEESEADLKVDMQNFDIGIAVRRSKPDSDMGGLVNLAIDVQSKANSIAELLANGNGYFDFSGNLDNFGAGIIDLWAVNLVAAIVSGAQKEKSELNCAVGRWSMTDGLLQSDAFFMDTSKIRICAKGAVNLKDQRVDIKVKPRAKKAEFFSLATPLEVHGSFSDINIGVGSGGVVGTAIKFIASPVTVPLSRIFSDKIPADGSDVCSMELGPDGRDEISVPKCK